MAADVALPEGFEVDQPAPAQPPAQAQLPAGFAVDPPKPSAEARAYEPTLRDKIARYLMGDEKPSALRERVVQGVVGSRGLGVTNPSLADLSPAGPVFAGEETQRSAQEGHWGEAALNALGVMPAAGAPVRDATRFALGRGLGTEARAARKVAGAAQIDAAQAKGASQGKTVKPEEIGPQELGANVNKALGSVDPNQDVRLIDMYGEATKREARTAANKSPEAGANLRDFLEHRFEGQSERTMDYLRSAYQNPQQAFQTVESLKQAARAPTSAEYTAAYAEGAKGISSPGLDQLMSSPTLKEIEKEAARRWEAKRVAGNNSNPMQVNGKLTLAFYDQVKRVLDDTVSGAKKAQDHELARDLDGIRMRLLDYLDGAVPEYASARGIAAQTFKAVDAVEAGEKAAQGNHTGAEIAAALQKMKPAERQQFQAGYLGDYLVQVGSVGDRKNLVTRLAASPVERERLSAVLGPQGADKFQAFLNVETVMDMARTGVGGNSTTVRQAHDAARDSVREITIPAMVGGAAVLATGNLKAALIGALMYGARRGQVAIDEKVATSVAEMMLSKDPKVYEKGLREITSSVPMQDSLRDFLMSERGISWQGGQAAHGMDALGKSEDQPQPVTSPEEAAGLPPGTWVKTPDGQIRRRK